MIISLTPTQVRTGITAINIIIVIVITATTAAVVPAVVVLGQGQGQGQGQDLPNTIIEAVVAAIGIIVLDQDPQSITIIATATATEAVAIPRKAIAKGIIAAIVMIKRWRILSLPR